MFGESSVIEWSTSNIGIFETLGIDLYQGNSKVYAISTSTINDGTYTFLIILPLYSQRGMIIG